MAPQDQFTIQQQVVIGLNSLLDPATPVAPTRALLSTSLEPSWEIQTEEFTPRGNKVPTIQSLNVDDSNANLSGKLEFNELGVFLASNLVGDNGNNTGVAKTPTSGTPIAAKIWEFTPKVTKQDTPQAFTAQYLGTGRGMQQNYCLVPSVQIGVDAQGGVSFGGQIMAQQLRDSADGLLPALVLASGLVGFPALVPVQVRGPANCVNVYLSKVSRDELGEKTTVSLAITATGTDVQTALRALPTITTTGVTVVGAAGGPWTLTFGGPLAALDVPKVKIKTNTLTGGTNPTVVTAVTVEGKELVATNEVQVLTLTGAPTSGTFTLAFSKTKLSRLRSTQWQTSGRWSKFYELDCDFPSWSTHIEAQMQGSVSISLGLNDLTMQLLRKTRAGERVWIRQEIGGPTIGAGPDRYMIEIDSCLFLRAPGAPQDMNGLMGVDFEGTFARDDNFGGIGVPGFTTVRLVNTAATLLG